jgi:hypothetical protein
MIPPALQELPACLHEAGYVGPVLVIAARSLVMVLPFMEQQQQQQRQGQKRTMMMHGHGVTIFSLGWWNKEAATTRAVVTEEEITEEQRKIETTDHSVAVARSRFGIDSRLCDCEPRPGI